MTDLPFHVIPVIINDQIRLRVYKGGNLEVELPLRQRQALVLAGQLLNMALTTTERGAVPATERTYQMFVL
jgi:hypothetical protein